MVMAYESAYEKLWPLIPNPNEIKTVIEVGINEGVGTRKLKSRFPNAHIFAIDCHVLDSDYDHTFDEILPKLENIATVIIERSPLPFEWAYPYDLCAIDIASMAAINLSQVDYWLKYKKPGGLLAIVIPVGEEIKRERRAKFLQKINELGLKYEEVDNWVVFR